MINAIDNGILVTDLNANNFSIVSISSISPIPSNLVDTSDPRLTDAREPLEGSVTNASVAVGAAIEQVKLDLNGDIPISWLGLDATHAAPGSAVEYVANKNVPGGYPGLDATGKVLPAHLPADVGTGTVTSVSLSMPAEFNVTTPTVTTSGVLTAVWGNAPDSSWFGNKTGGSAVPTFNTGAIAVSMVPQLPASKITSGTLDPARLPTAIGVGPSSSTGAVPDPGPSGLATDYLARDMTYKPVPTIGPSYQPTVPNPTLFSVGGAPGFTTVSISSSLAGSSIFYQITGMTDYAPAPSSVSVESGKTLNVYAAKAGYTNSNVVTYP